MKMVEASPMKVPSIVLPLLIVGIIFLLPNNLPPKYAKMSIVLTKITAYKIVYNPLGNCKITIREKKETIIKLYREEMHDTRKGPSLLGPFFLFYGQI